MSTKSIARHRRHSGSSQLCHTTSGGFATLTPEAGGLAMKLGVVAAGSVVASAALVGGGMSAQTVSGAPAAHTVGVALAAAPTFEESVQAVFNLLGVGTVGELLGKIGPGLGTESELSALLADLNPGNLTLDALTGNILGSNIGDLLDKMYIGTTSLGDISINGLLGTMLGGEGAGASLYDLMNGIGLGSYAGLVDALGICGYGDTCLLGFGTLDANDSIGAWVSALLDMNTSTATLSDLALGNGVTLGDADLNDLLGITDAQLALPWDEYLSELATGGGILDPGGTGMLGDETLGELLNSLLPVGSGISVVDGTEMTAFLDALGFFSLFGM